MYLKYIFYMRELGMRSVTTSYGKNLHLSRVGRSAAPKWRPETKHRLHQTLGVLLMAVVAVAVIYRLLSHVSSDVIVQMLWGLGGIACALGGLATLLWGVRRGLAWDNAQEEARIRKQAAPAKNKRA